jgi:hypothetical protein
MKRHQHADRRRAWDPNDHYDINALSMALPYCDALLADKHWADKIERARLGELNGCGVLRTPGDLLSYLTLG